MSNYDHFVGTGPVGAQNLFDAQALAVWLREHLEGFDGPLSVELFKGGQSNQIGRAHV